MRAFFIQAIVPSGLGAVFYFVGHHLLDLRYRILVRNRNILMQLRQCQLGCSKHGDEILNGAPQDGFLVVREYRTLEQSRVHRHERHEFVGRFVSVQSKFLGVASAQKLLRFHSKLLEQVRYLAKTESLFLIFSVAKFDFSFVYQGDRLATAASCFGANKCQHEVPIPIPISMEWRSLAKT